MNSNSKSDSEKKGFRGQDVAEQYRAQDVLISRSHNPDLENIPVPAYTDEEHGTWAIMFERQMRTLGSYASREFLEGLKKLDLPPDRIPKLKDVSQKLQSATGWRITRVDGLVPEKEFFECLAQKLFPCTDFIRKREELDYTPSPDMFHDIFGHLPMITNSYFSDFYEYFGKAALKADREQLTKLQRIYWFTVEFGLIQNPEGARIYGSGILSSMGEVPFSLGPKVRRHPFDYKVVENQYYEIHHMQEDLFVIPSFPFLLESFRNYAKKEKLVA